MSILSALFRTSPETSLPTLDAPSKSQDAKGSKSAPELVRVGVAKGLAPTGDAWASGKPTTSVRERLVGLPRLDSGRAPGATQPSQRDHGTMSAGPAPRASLDGAARTLNDETDWIAASLTPAYLVANDEARSIGDRTKAALSLSEIQFELRAAVKTELGSVEAKLAAPTGLTPAERSGLNDARLQLLERAVAIELPALASTSGIDALAAGLADLRDRLPAGPLRDLAGSEFIRTLSQQHPMQSMHAVLDGMQPKGEILVDTLSAITRALAGDDEALSLNVLNGLKLGETPLRDLTTALRATAFQQRAAQTFLADLIRTGGADAQRLGLDAPPASSGDPKASIARIRNAIAASVPDRVTSFDAAMAAADTLAVTHEALQEQRGRLARTLGSETAPGVAAQIMWAVSTYIDSDAEVAAGRDRPDPNATPVKPARVLLELAKVKELAAVSKDGAFQIARYARLLEESSSQQQALFGRSNTGAVDPGASADRIVALLGLDLQELKDLGYETDTAQKILDTSRTLGEHGWSDTGETRNVRRNLQSVTKETLGDVNNQAAVNRLAAKQMDLSAKALVEKVQEGALRSLHPTGALPVTGAEKTAALKTVVSGLQAKILGEAKPFENYILMLRAGAQRDQIEQDKIGLADRRAALDAKVTAALATLNAIPGNDARNDLEPDGLRAAKIISAAAQDVAIAEGSVRGIRMEGMADKAARSIQSLSTKQLERIFGDKSVAAQIKKDGPTRTQIAQALPRALAVIALREDLATERAELAKIQDGIEKIEASRDKRAIIGAENSVVTGLKRLIAGGAETRIAASLARTGSSDLQRAFKLDEAAHDALDRIIRMVASEVMIEKTGGRPDGPFEPAHHRAEIETRLTELGVATTMMSANITDVLRAPMTDQSMEQWLKRESIFDDFRNALGTSPSFFSAAGFAEKRATSLNAAAINDKVALQMSKQATMDERTQHELVTLLGTLEPGDHIRFSAGQAVSGKWTQKLDPALLSSVTLRLGVQSTRDLVIERTADGWRIGSLMGAKVTARAEASVGASLDTVMGRAPDHSSQGVTAEAVLTARLGGGGERNQGAMLAIPGAAEGLDTIVDTLMGVIKGQAVARDLLEATESPMAVTVIRGELDVGLSASAQIGFRAAHGGEAGPAASWKDKPGGLMLGVRAGGDYALNGSREEGTSLDRTYVKKITKHEITLGIQPTMSIDVRAIASARGDAIKADILKGDPAGAGQSVQPEATGGAIGDLVDSFIDDKSIAVKGEVGKVFGKQSIQANATVGNALFDLITKEALGKRLDNLSYTKSVATEHTVQNLRVGEDDFAELAQATIVRRVNVDGVFDVARTLWHMLDESTKELVRDDPLVRSDFQKVLDAASIDSGERNLELISHLTPKAASIIRDLNQLHRKAVADDDLPLADAYKAQLKARLFDDDSYQPAGIRLIRERDTAGIDSSIPLYLIDIGRAHGVKSRQEQAYLQFAGQRI